MIFREASPDDIPGMSLVRYAVRENPLNTPGLVTEADYMEFLTVRGKGWVCTIQDRVVGFAIVDLQGRNIWALFVHPDQAENGMGKALHRLMMDWYFQQTSEPVWLGTAPDTRAEVFYEKMGWRKVGLVNKGEVKFEMGLEDWLKSRPASCGPFVGFSAIISLISPAATL
ncbi:MAG: GNAT family N-acetyltransferase [Saprospiraceae bacterium]